MGRVLIVVALVDLLVGGAVAAWGVTSGSQPVLLAGGAIAALSLPWLLVGLSLQGRARVRPVPTPVVDGTSSVAPTDDPTADDPTAVDPASTGASSTVSSDVSSTVSGGVSSTEPSVGDHVVDGIMRRPRARQTLSLLLPGAVALAAGIGLWAIGWWVVGLVVALVGTLGLALVLSAFAILVRRGATWTEQPTGGWPDGEGTAEVLEVWDLGDLDEARVHGFVLRVHAGGRAWEVKIRQAVPVEWAGALGQRLRLAVRADPARQDRVAIDWAASEHPGTG